MVVETPWGQERLSPCHTLSCTSVGDNSLSPACLLLEKHSSPIFCVSWTEITGKEIKYCQLALSFPYVFPE